VRSAYLLLIVLALTAGCAPRNHSVVPYRDDAIQADALAARAAAACAAHAPLPPRPFVTDGCSAWPDSTWVSCCVEHDIEYWCGGSTDQRLAADRELRECVADVAGPTWGSLMFWGVRAGGGPRLPFAWRWGYGWPWRARVPEQ
jgi:hypothetical protein